MHECNGLRVYFHIGRTRRRRVRPEGVAHGREPDSQRVLVLPPLVFRICFRLSQRLEHP